jgi:riboflavin transporter FmnP
MFLDLLIMALLVGVSYLVIQSGGALLSAITGVAIGIFLSDFLKMIINYFLE